ncbi:SDR family NAD(P)-dependent oxidoreductase, partial [Streptomyces bohaiensis]
ALFAVETALFRLLESWGVRPDLVAGHSVGELAAAHAAGVWSLPDACAVVAARARAMHRLPPGGAMSAVDAAEQDVAASLTPYGGRVVLAAVNSPHAVVVSGPAQDVEALTADWSGRGARVKRLDVSHAFHSPAMDPALAPFRAAVRSVTAHPPALPLISNRTARPLTATEAADPDYWADQLRGTVRFGDGVARLEEEGVTTFLEVGPAALASLVPDSLKRPAGTAVPLLRRGRPEAATLVAGIGRLVARGHELRLGALFDGSGARPAELPTYAFRHRRYWIGEPPGSPGDTARLGLDTTGHPLLGASVPLPDGGAVLTGRLSLADQPWLADHRVLDRVLLPGSALVEAAVRAGDRTGAGTVDELVLQAPLVLTEAATVRLRAVVGPSDPSGTRTLRIDARPDSDEFRTGDETGWTTHATGTLRSAAARPAAATGTWPPPGADALATQDVYQALRAVGVDYGPAFRALRAMWREGDTVHAEVELPEAAGPARGGDFAEGYGVHPALLDSCLHALRFSGFLDADAAFVPFAVSGVTLYATGARALRVTLTHLGGESVRLLLADTSGAPVASVDTLTVRKVTRDRVVDRDPALDHLYRLDWTPLPEPSAAAPDADGGWALLGQNDPYATGLPTHDPEDGAAPPAVLVWSPPTPGDDAHTATRAALDVVRTHLADPAREGTRLLVLTRGAVAALPGEPVPDLAGAAVHGLVGSAQSEQPGRIVLVDAEDGAGVKELATALATGEPRTALRGGLVLAPRLAHHGTDGALAPLPGEPAWRLGMTGTGTVENLRVVPCPEALAPLDEGQVRIGVRAAGLNFRDVFTVLGMFPSITGMLGGEAAGVVLETGPGVRGLRPGDRVTGLVFGGFGPVAVADRRMVTPFPRSWTFEQAAAVPLVFLTAYHALTDLAGVRPGERVLVHAAAGGVGMAALQLARHLGAEVYGTAHPGKWDTLRALGLDERRTASSRTTDFEEAFAGSGGLDVVLNSLTGEFVDASLRLLRDGGRFLEMGKVDIRDPEAVAAAHQGVRYRAFDVLDAGEDRIQQMLTELVGLFEQGVLTPLPVTPWHVHRAPEAFRYLREARHTGKVVLTVPRRPDPDGTVLVTGGTGDLGALVARHLVASRGVRHLLLASRRGDQAPGARELAAELRSAGAEVTVAACDVADRDAVRRLLASVPPTHPLTGVVHTAGVVEDGVVTALTPDRLARVLAPKADAALHLHELTADQDLALFVLFSSAAAVLGGPGQGNYAAANALLDALAAHRRARGSVATSLAWGLWRQDGAGITAHLGEGDLARMARSGLLPLEPRQGLALLDLATATGDAFHVPLRLDPAALADAVAPEEGHGLPAVLRGLTARRPARRSAASPSTEETGDGFARRVAALPPAAARREATDLVRTLTAGVLGRDRSEGVDGVPPDRPFQSLGFDSLTAVELRNQLARATGEHLPPTVVFDHPTPEALARYLTVRLLGEEAVQPETASDPEDADAGEIDAMDEEELIRRALGGGS